jgi:hypothetical protein
MLYKPVITKDPPTLGFGDGFRFSFRLKAAYTVRLLPRIIKNKPKYLILDGRYSRILNGENKIRRSRKVCIRNHPLFRIVNFIRPDSSSYEISCLSSLEAFPSDRSCTIPYVLLPRLK